MATSEGGLPAITSRDAHIESIGVSEAATSDDGICAQAGRDAIAVQL